MSFEIINADCLKAMADMPDNSVDAIVTDPPYGLSFMNKKWDYEVPSVQIWQEALRVLKPGGHLLCACGTRTQHRMVCNIEDAGFEIRDVISWIYGCLSEDTEIYTINGWERYNKNIEKTPVLTYTIDRNEFKFETPKRKFLYENKYTAYSIKSDFTDQIVSRNHRVLIERDGKLLFREAETLQRQENIPILEGLSGVSGTVYDTHKTSSGSQQVLFKSLCRKDYNKDKEAVRRKESNPSCLSSLREKVLYTNGTFRQGGNSLLFKTVQRSSKRTRMGFSCIQGQFGVDRRRQGNSQRTNDGGVKSVLERRNYVYEKEGLLLRRDVDKVCPMSSRIHEYVQKGRVCNGTPINNGDAHRKGFREDRMCSSYQSQPNGQSDREFNAIQEQCRTQEIRITRAEITPIVYEGKVWCIQVDSGCFVARRNGKIFLTGNSGFPKSLSIGKAIDKEQGNEREVIGKMPNPATPKQGTFNCSFDENKAVITAPASPESAQWEGWGTALKPACEFWTLARKPLEKGLTVAQNVLKWGTGGINIDGCRVEGNWMHGRGSIKPQTNHFDKFKFSDKHTKLEIVSHPAGRFPANIIHDGSDEVLAGFPMTGGSVQTQKNISLKRQDNKIYGKGLGMMNPNNTYSEPPGSASRFFYCAKASKRDRDEGCEDMELRQTIGGGGTNNTEDDVCGKYGSIKSPAHNFHPTVKPTALMSYLCRLVTPPNGIVLDPFMGSGSTGKGAILEGFNFIGIELDPEYCKIAEARVKNAMENKQETLF